MRQIWVNESDEADEVNEAIEADEANVDRWGK